MANTWISVTAWFLCPPHPQPTDRPWSSPSRAHLSEMTLPSTNPMSHHYLILFPIFFIQSLCLQNIVGSTSRTLHLISSLLVSAPHRGNKGMCHSPLRLPYTVVQIVAEQPYGRVPLTVKHCKLYIYHRYSLAGVNEVPCILQHLENTWKSILQQFSNKMEMPWGVDLPKGAIWGSNISTSLRTKWQLITRSFKA